MFVENLGDRFIATVSNAVGLNAGDGSSFFARCYLSTEAVSCRLLQRIAGRDGDGLKLEKLDHFFQCFNS